jgi:hypothetical protein
MGMPLLGWYCDPYSNPQTEIFDELELERCGQWVFRQRLLGMSGQLRTMLVWASGLWGTQNSRCIERLLRCRVPRSESYVFFELKVQHSMLHMLGPQ